MDQQQRDLLYTALIFVINSGVLAAVAGFVASKLIRHFGVARVQAAGEIAGRAVAAVEQMAAAQGWSNLRMRDEAIHRAWQLGQAHGIDYSQSQWETLIEAAVLALHQAGDATTRVIAGTDPQTGEQVTMVETPTPAATKPARPRKPRPDEAGARVVTDATERLRAIGRAQTPADRG